MPKTTSRKQNKLSIKSSYDPNRMDNQPATGKPKVIDPPQSEDMMDPTQTALKPNVTVSSSVGELLECPVCLNAMCPPIYQCLNGHTLCSSCKPKVHNRCPICRQKLGNIRCLALEKMAASLELPCKYQSFGCMGKYPYDSKLKHELQCVYRPDNCPYAGPECTVIGDNQHGQDESEDVWSRPNWPPLLEKMLVELMIEEMKYHVDMYAGNFKEESWDCVCKEFNAESNKTELKKHLAVLRKRYCIVKPLYNHGGFGWDYRRKMVDVDDLVWREYIEAYPKIKPYRKYGCPIYEDLCTIFTKPIATGEYAIAVGGGSVYCSSSISLSRGNVNNMNGRNKRQSVEPMSSGANKRNCKGVGGAKANATPEANSGSRPRGTAMARAEDPHSEGHCISIINGMQGVDQCLFNVAVDLFQTPSWRQTFMSLKSEKRLTWLKAMLPNVP